jgi:hypothetical protein
MSHEDPFANYNPEEDKREGLPGLLLSSVGDAFKGTITNIGSVYETEYYSKYAIELELTYVNIKPVPANEEEGTEAYEPPKVGDKAVYYVKLTTAKTGKTHHIQEVIQRSLAKVGKNGLDVGDELALKLIEKVQSEANKKKGFKPFRKHAAITVPGTPKAEEDPFEAPF